MDSTMPSLSSCSGLSVRLKTHNFILNLFVFTYTTQKYVDQKFSPYKDTQR